MTSSNKYWRIQLVSESSGPQFLRTTSGIQLEPAALNESRFIMTFFNQLGKYSNIMQF